MSGNKRKKPVLSLEELAHRERIRDLFNGVMVATVIVWVFRFCLCGLVSLTKPVLDYYSYTLLYLLAESVAIALPFVIFHKGRREYLAPIFTESSAPDADHSVLHCLFGAFAVFCLSFAAMEAVDLFRALLEGWGVHTAVETPDLGQSVLQTGYYVVLSSVLRAVTLEFAFRGVAQRALAPENRFCAVLVAGLSFAFVDGNMALAVVRLAVGFLIGAFYLRFRSFWGCVLLQGCSQISVSIWWIMRSIFVNGELSLYSPFLLLVCFVLGLGAALYLFYPFSREKKTQTTSTKVALQQIFSSFAVYLLIGLMAFSLLITTFSTDADPADPLLQPTPEEGVKPPLHFDREEELGTDDGLNS